MRPAQILPALKKRPAVAASLVVILASAATLYFRWDLIDEVQADYDNKHREDQQILTNLRNATGLVKELDTIKQATKQVDDRLIYASKLASNQQYFYRLENDTGVKLTGIHQNPTGRPIRAAYYGVPYNLTVQGSFKSVMDFIRRLEGGTHISRFNTLTFTKAAAGSAGSDSGEALNVAMNIELLGEP